MTGGEDDKAYVWRLSDGEVLLECTGESSHTLDSMITEVTGNKTLNKTMN